MTGSDLTARIEGELKVRELVRRQSVTLAPCRAVPGGQRHHLYVYRVVDGWACSVRSIAEGRKQFTQLFLTGDFIGLPNLFASIPEQTVQTLSRTVLERVEATHLKQVFSHDPQVATWCFNRLVHDLNSLGDWIVALGRANAEERLARLFIHLRERLVCAGVIEATCWHYPLPLTQIQLADLLALTPVHINRVLRSFRERGIVIVGSGTVNILDDAGLRACAEALLDSETAPPGRRAKIGSTGARLVTEVLPHSAISLATAMRP